MLACFDIGGTRIKAGFSRTAGEIDQGAQVATPRTDFDAFAGVLAGAVAGRDVAGVSIAIAGGVDPATGILTCANIPCVHGRGIAADLARTLGLPVWVGNDADCFALAEAREGAGRGHSSVFGVILGTGVGGGLVLDGRIVTGAGGFSGEWGHGPVLRTEAMGVHVPHFACGCGLSGCVDTLGGARGLERLYLHLHGEVLTSEAVLAAWRRGQAGQTLAVWLDLVSAPLAMVLNVVGATVVPVGGGLSNAGDLVAALDTAVRARVLRRTAEPLLVPAALRVEPGLIGAAWLGWQGLGHG